MNRGMGIAVGLGVLAAGLSVGAVGALAARAYVGDDPHALAEGVTESTDPAATPSTERVGRLGQATLGRRLPKPRASILRLGAALTASDELVALGLQSAQRQGEPDVIVVDSLVTFRIEASPSGAIAVGANHDVFVITAGGSVAEGIDTVEEVMFQTIPISADGRPIAAATDAGAIYLYRSPSWRREELVRPGETRPAHFLATSHDGEELLAIDESNALTRWSLDGRVLNEYDLDVSDAEFVFALVRLTSGQTWGDEPRRPVRVT
jgi:hypothetical protein